MAESELSRRGHKLRAKMLRNFHGHSVHLSWLIFLVFLRIGYSYSGPDVEGEALIDFLRFLNDSNHLIDWNNYPMSTCFSWPHVTCRDGNVVSLVLDSKGFSGTLSPAITKLKYLVSLELQNNDLTGELPDFLGDMENLQILNLANNKFSGNLPATWGRLSNLRNLILCGNHLSGPVPDTIANISKLTELDLSSNDLTGKIPVRLFSLPNFNFTLTHLLCGSNSDQPCVSRPLVPASPKRLKLGVVAAVIFGIFFLFSLGAIFSYQYLKFRKQKPDEFFDVAGEDDQKISLAQVRRFSWGEIQIATDNFSESTVIGKGGFGKVYRGVLSDGTKVAVKRLTDYYSPGGEAAFQREVQLISVAVHRNLLRLIGFCTTSLERILVYPYMKNLSVAYHLRDLKPGEKGLNWGTRWCIALGAAHGLEYLHERCNPKIIHRDVKAANILLDDDFKAVLGDFGLAKPVDPKLTHVTTQVRGTMGHIAPEYLSTGKTSEKTDVFGYGITLLELVTGRRATGSSGLEEVEVVLLLDHIKKLLKEDRLDMVDRNLVAYDPKEVETIVQVALLCTQDLPKDRPRMSEVVNMLQGVGLSQMGVRWEQSKGEIDWRYYHMSNHFTWVGETTQLEAVQLSSPR